MPHLELAPCTSFERAQGNKEICVIRSSRGLFDWISANSFLTKNLRSFEVICQFNNEYRGEHHFIFKDAKEEGAAGDGDGKEDVEEAFSKQDTDGDGVLSFDEFKKMMGK